MFDTFPKFNTAKKKEKKTTEGIPNLTVITDQQKSYSNVSCNLTDFLSVPLEFPTICKKKCHFTVILLVASMQVKVSQTGGGGHSPGQVGHCPIPVVAPHGFSDQQVS